MFTCLNFLDFWAWSIQTNHCRQFISEMTRHYRALECFFKKLLFLFGCFLAFKVFKHYNSEKYLSSWKKSTNLIYTLSFVRPVNDSGVKKNNNLYLNLCKMNLTFIRPTKFCLKYCIINISTFFSKNVRDFLWFYCASYLWHNHGRKNWNSYIFA